MNIQKIQSRLSEKLSKEVTVPPFPKNITKESLEKLKEIDYRPVFFPNINIDADFNVPGFTKIDTPFYDKIKSGQYPEDFSLLEGGWYLVDFGEAMDFTDGSQEYPNDHKLLGPIISRLRKNGKIGKYKNTAPGSRYAITGEEWINVVSPEIKKSLIKNFGFPQNQIEVRLERAIEYNFIGNIYDTKRGTFKGLELFSDTFTSNGFEIMLCGGSSGHEGIKYVIPRPADYRGVSMAARPIIRLT